MTTVSDPSGSPVPVYNKSGVTIVEVTANAVSGSATSISALSGHTIAVVTPPEEAEQSFVKLPSSSSIGDVVEVYGTTSANVFVVPPSGETLKGQNKVRGDLSGATFRKLTSTGWWSTAGAF